jgi:hypothetical protein
MTQAVGWIDTALSSGPAVESIGTLGPAGTSSERAALHLWACHSWGGPPDIHLYDAYEDAGTALSEGAVSHVVVANAYAGVHSFYMDPSLRFAGAFLLGVLSECWVFVGEDHAVRELEERIVHVVSGFPADP